MHGAAKLSFQSDLGAAPDVHGFSLTIRELGDPQDPADSTSGK